MAKNITPQEKNFSQWYLDLIQAGQLADYAPVRGCMIIRPTGKSFFLVGLCFLPFFVILMNVLVILIFKALRFYILCLFYAYFFYGYNEI